MYTLFKVRQKIVPEVTVVTGSVGPLLIGTFDRPNDTRPNR
jgi:hypothetical protein